MKTVTTMRKRNSTIRDEYISDDIIEDLALDFLTVCESPLDFKNVDVIKYFYKNETFSIGAKTISRIIRYLKPNSKSTAGSVRLQISKLNERQRTINDLIMHSIMREV